jgi:flavin reductase (DIM6/NTAB) family NADH-FMN oxidoreductase RutF
VNVLSAGQASVAEMFAGQPRAGVAYDFDQAIWEARVTGCPVLIGAAATFDCTMNAAMDAGTHRVFVGRVLESGCWPGASLSYRLRHYGIHEPFEERIVTECYRPGLGPALSEDTSTTAASRSPS